MSKFGGAIIAPSFFIIPSLLLSGMFLVELVWIKILRIIANMISAANNRLFYSITSFINFSTEKHLIFCLDPAQKLSKSLCYQSFVPASYCQRDQRESLEC